MLLALERGERHRFWATATRLAHTAQVQCSAGAALASRGARRCDCRIARSRLCARSRLRAVCGVRFEQRVRTVSSKATQQTGSVRHSSDSSQSASVCGQTAARQHSSDTHPLRRSLVVLTHARLDGRQQPRLATQCSQRLAPRHNHSSFASRSSSPPAAAVCLASCASVPLRVSCLVAADSPPTLRRLHLSCPSGCRKVSPRPPLFAPRRVGHTDTCYIARQRQCRRRAPLATVARLASRRSPSSPPARRLHQH